MADDTEQKQPQEIASTEKAQAKSTKTKKDEISADKKESIDAEDSQVDGDTSSKKTRKKSTRTKSSGVSQDEKSEKDAKADSDKASKQKDTAEKEQADSNQADAAKDIEAKPVRKRRGRPRMTEEQKAAAAAERKRKAAAAKAAKAAKEQKAQEDIDKTDESKDEKTQTKSQDVKPKSSSKSNSKQEYTIEEKSQSKTADAKDVKTDSDLVAPKSSDSGDKKPEKSDEATKTQVEAAKEDVADAASEKDDTKMPSKTKAEGPTRRRRTVTRRKKTVDSTNKTEAEDQSSVDEKTSDKATTKQKEPVVYTEDQIALLIKKATETQAASGIMPAPSQVLPKLDSQADASEEVAEAGAKAKKQEVTRTRTAATRTKTVRRRVVRRTIKKKDSDSQNTSTGDVEVKNDNELQVASQDQPSEILDAKADLDTSKQAEKTLSRDDESKEQVSQNGAETTQETSEDKGVQRRKRVVRSVKIDKPQKNQTNGRKTKKNSNSGMEPSLTKEELKEMKVAEIREKARELDLDPTGIRKAELIELVYDAAAYAEGFRTCKGVLEIQADGYGFIRSENYMQGKDDAFVYNQLIRQYGLRSGDEIEGTVVPARSAKNYPPVQQIIAINGRDPELARKRPRFKDLTPVYPNERLIMEHGKSSITGRAIDLVAPIGKGQRGLIVSPPKAGKTTILKKICQSIAANNPEVHLICLLVDERPEEVTDMQRSIKGEVVASTFDMPPENHTTVSELVIERAKRLVEQGEDVVVVLDSITRLARAYNLAEPASGRILSGGVDSAALYPPKRFLGAARNIENGGSLTILASALVDTGSKMDEVIFEEFKGTGNMELKLDRDLANRRIYPAIDPVASGTRNEDLLLEEVERSCVWGLRRTLVGFNNTERAATMLIKSLKETPNNKVFLLAAAKKSQNVDFSDQQS